MKKIFYLFLALAAIGFSSCSDDKEDLQNDLLEGTSWVYTEKNGSVVWTEMIEFKTDGKCVYSYMERIGLRVTDHGEATGTYRYTPPVVKCTVTMDGETATQKLTVDGDSMTDERGQVFEKR